MPYMFGSGASPPPPPPSWLHLAPPPPPKTQPLPPLKVAGEWEGVGVWSDAAPPPPREKAPIKYNPSGSPNEATGAFQNVGWRGSVREKGV